MEEALLNFYYHFHKHQHYFLCHDILEEAWKKKPNYSKNDGIVSLILFSTAMYHYRRHNYNGALKSFEKSLTTFINARDKVLLGLNEEVFAKQIEHQIKNVYHKNNFVPIQLPMTEEMVNKIYHVYPDYTFNALSISDSYIVHHHKLRDRSDVINAREQALIKKHEK